MIQCEKCYTQIDTSHINTKTFLPCTNCGTLLRTDIFMAAVKPHEINTDQQTLIVSDDAGCYYHPTKKAVIPCVSCGRFLCALCDIDMDGEHICFPCMESGPPKKAAQTLETHRFLPDGLAIRLSFFPLFSMFFTFFTCVTAPLSIYFVIRHWKSASSITPRRKKWRFILAFLVSSAQIAGWAGIIFMSINS